MKRRQIESNQQSLQNILISMQFDHLYHPLNLTREAYYSKLRRNLSGQTIGNYLIDKQPKDKLNREKYKLSRVFTAINIHDSTKVAIKVIDIGKTRDCDSKTYQQYLNFLRKQSDLMMEGHQHILKCHQVYQNEFLKIMVLDYCEYNLEQKIQLDQKIDQQDQKIRLQNQKRQEERKEYQSKIRQQKMRLQEKRRQQLKRKQQERRRWQENMRQIENGLSDVDKKIVAFYRKHDPENQKNYIKEQEPLKNVTSYWQLTSEQKKEQQQLVKKRIEAKKDYRVFQFAIQILQGLEVLHSRNIVHYDLKATGILYHKGTYLISDIGINSQTSNSNEFGLKRMLKNWRKKSIKERRLTQSHQQRTLNFKADIWQLGAILFYVAFHKNIICQPLFTLSIQAFSSLNNKLSYNGRTPCDSLSVLIKIMLADKEEDRPSCQFILKKLKLDIGNKFIRAFNVRQYQHFKEPKVVPHYYFSEYKNINDHRIYVEKCRLYAKAQLLQSELLISGIKQRVFDIDDSKTIEFLHLLSIRCQNDYVPLKAFLKQKGNYDAQYSQMASACIEDQKRIILRQNIFNQFFKSRSTIINKSIYSTLDTSREDNNRINFDIYQGCEGRDYSREEQINFMLNYLPDVIKCLHSVGEATIRVRKILKFMKKLFQLEEKDLKMLSVKEYVEKQLRLIT